MMVNVQNTNHIFWNQGLCVHEYIYEIKERQAVYV